MGLFDFFKKKKEQKLQQAIEVKIRETPLSVNQDFVSLDTLLKTAIKNSSGLYPHEILILFYIEGFYKEQETFQSFWLYNYGIENVRDILNNLFDRNFIQIGTLESSINLETASSIKEQLKKQNLKVSGKKEELVKRLLNEVSIDVLSGIFTKHPYELTETGKQAISKEEYVLYIHKNNIEDLNIWTMNKMMNEKPYYPYRDKIWGYLNSRLIKHFQDFNFGFYRNCRLHMFNFLMEEKKYIDAIDKLTEVIYFDLNGLSNNFNIKYLDIISQNFFPYETSTLKIASGIIKNLIECKDKLNLSDNDLFKILIQQKNFSNIPLSIFTIEDSAGIAILEINNNQEDLKKIYDNAEIRFKEKYKNVKIKNN
jgi:hypothetical protein